MVKVGLEPTALSLLDSRADQLRHSTNVIRPISSEHSDTFQKEKVG